MSKWGKDALLAMIMIQMHKGNFIAKYEITQQKQLFAQTLTESTISELIEWFTCDTNALRHEHLQNQYPAPTPRFGVVL